MRALSRRELSHQVSFSEERQNEMQSTEFLRWLADSEPQLPLPSLVEEVNNLFHSFDAAHYDHEHPEIFEVLPALWRDMVGQLPNRKDWRILDFGCGTGFEASEIMRYIAEKVEQLTCFDPCPEMLAHCRNRLKGIQSASFHTRLEEALSHGPFNLLATNSLLHHLPDVRQSINALLPDLTSDAIWLAGHEPSTRFFRNSECLRFLDEYSQYYRWAKLVMPRVYITKMRILLGRHPLPATAKAALRRGWFKRLPHPLLIDRIVDFHVLHGEEELNDRRGLDFERMQNELAPEWCMKWLRTYSFFGPFKSIDAPRRWVKRSCELAEKFPEDGANFAIVWSRQ